MLKKKKGRKSFREELVAVCHLGIGDERITTLFVNRES